MKDGLSLKIQKKVKNVEYLNTDGCFGIQTIDTQFT